MKRALSKDMIHSAARDVGNRSRMKENRTAWNRQDYDKAVKEYDRLTKIK